ncbi:MAG: hypothetical protein ACYST5_23120, partial [Planctomycetota bacterium]
DFAFIPAWLLVCRSLIDGCHCEERSDEAISTICKSEIATAFFKDLAMTVPQIMCYRALRF